MVMPSYIMPNNFKCVFLINANLTSNSFHNHFSRQFFMSLNNYLNTQCEDFWFIHLIAINILEVVMCLFPCICVNPAVYRQSLGTQNSSLVISYNISGLYQTIIHAVSNWSVCFKGNISRTYRTGTKLTACFTLEAYSAAQHEPVHPCLRHSLVAACLLQREAVVLFSSFTYVRVGDIERKTRGKKEHKMSDVWIMSYF